MLGSPHNTACLMEHDSGGIDRDKLRILPQREALLGVTVAVEGPMYPPGPDRPNAF